ncbi:MAG TPA: glycosyltransferase, partial [Methylovirgula sp.]
LLPLEALAGEVTLLGRPSTFRLLSTLAAPPRFIDKVADESLYDYQIALMSLPQVFGTSPATVPAPVAYLCAEPERVAQWRREIGDRGYRIGICWRGNMKINLERSLPLAEFAKLAAIPGVRLFNLMKDGDDDIRSLNLPVERLDRLDAGPDAFLDTAAAVMNLDLVVTSDTSIAHLAGALGRPTYLALKHVPDWRWLHEGETSPWYPTLRLFRQSTRGDWASVFDRMAVDIARRA